MEATNDEEGQETHLKRIITLLLHGADLEVEISNDKTVMELAESRGRLKEELQIAEAAGGPLFFCINFATKNIRYFRSKTEYLNIAKWLLNRPKGYFR